MYAKGYAKEIDLGIFWEVELIGLFCYQVGYGLQNQENRQDARLLVSLHIICVHVIISQSNLTF
jgi:hypothetical protein